ncbi:MAG: hypothetical protein MJ132_01210 [Clostridia bacterium]|nr:hypothetical protein [Clostridia bacterium]
MKKILALILSVILAVAFAGCGGSKETKEKKEEKMKGTTENWGEISVFVPDGFEFKGGSITGVDDTDEKQCYMKKDPTAMFEYIWIVVNEEEAVKNNIAMTKSVNSAEDITVSADNGEWTGCHYLYAGATGDVDCGAIYAVIDGTAFQVNFAGYAPESKEMKAVLSSLKSAK